MVGGEVDRESLRLERNANAIHLDRDGSGGARRRCRRTRPPTGAACMGVTPTCRWRSWLGTAQWRHKRSGRLSV